jgi:hypothetical protein
MNDNDEFQTLLHSMWLFYCLERPYTVVVHTLKD